MLGCNFQTKLRNSNCEYIFKNINCLHVWNQVKIIEIEGYTDTKLMLSNLADFTVNVEKNVGQCHKGHIKASIYDIWRGQCNTAVTRIEN